MTTQFSTINPQQLREVKRRRRYAPVLDVRSVAEYRGGHIPDAPTFRTGILPPSMTACSASC